MSMVQAAITRINEAFSGVELGDGISLLEANVIDYCGSDEERTDARIRDERSDWREIPDERIEQLPSALCFMDPKAVRFHLPAYMSFSLRRHLDSEAQSADSAIDYLSNPASLESLRPILTEEQVQAITTYLSTCLEIGEEWLDVEDVRVTLQAWSGDEAAARKLSEKRQEFETQWKFAEESVLRARKYQDRWLLVLAIIIFLCILFCMLGIVMHMIKSS